MRLTMGSGLLRTAWGNAVCVTIPAPPACKAVARAIAARRTRSAGVSPAGWPAGLPPAVVELQVCRGSRQRHIELPGGRGESPIHHLLRMHRTCHAARHCPRPKRTQGSKKHTHGGLLRVHRALPAHKLDDCPSPGLGATIQRPPRSIYFECRYLWPRRPRTAIFDKTEGSLAGSNSRNLPTHHINRQNKHYISIHLIGAYPYQQHIGVDHTDHAEAAHLERVHQASLRSAGGTVGRRRRPAG